MEKAKVKNLQNLMEQAAVCYGEKAFLKEKAGKEIVEISFIKLLEAEQPEMHVTKTSSGTKKNFFGLAGKIHLNRDFVTELREASVL